MIILLQVAAVSKSIQGRVLFRDLTFNCDIGDMVFIVGESGCGKTTLLNMLAGYDSHYEGHIVFNNQEMKTKNKRKQRPIRKQIGMIFQDLNLIEYYRNDQNICLFQNIHNKDLDYMLDYLRIRQVATKYPSQVSGGEQQRVAIARTFLHNPVMILADEPTGSLDENNATIVLDALKKQSDKSLVIVVSHHMGHAQKYATKIIDLAHHSIIDNQPILVGELIILEEKSEPQWKDIFLHQLKIFVRRWRHFLLPCIIGGLTYLLILGSFSFYHSFLQQLQSEQSMRRDQDYLMLEMKGNSEDNAALLQVIENQKGVEIKPYYQFLNSTLVTYLYYDNEVPFFKNFYFEIIPLIGLGDQNIGAINQQFYQECNQRIDTIFLRFKSDGNVVNISLPIIDIIQDGMLYNSPRLFIDYAMCLELWPDLDLQEEKRIFYFPDGSQQVKSYLAHSKLVVSHYQNMVQKKDITTYDYSGYLLDQMIYDLQNQWLGLIVAMAVFITLMITSLQSLIFAYLMIERYQEVTLLRAYGMPSYIRNYILIHDLTWTNILSFIFSIIVYSLLLFILPVSGILSTLNISSFGVIASVIFLIINIALCSVFMMIKLSRSDISALLQEKALC